MNSKKKKGLKLWHKVTLGLLLGIIFGFSAPSYVGYVKPVGDIFLSLIKMIVIPLIYFSLIVGITSVSDSKILGRIGAKSTFSYLITSMIAVCVGVGTALLMKPGMGIIINFSGSEAIAAPSKEVNFVDIITSIVPSNALAAMVNSEFLQVVFFAIFTGLTLNKMADEGKRLIDFCNLINNMLFKMMSIIISFSPYGAFALTAWVVGTQGVDVLHSLGKLILAVFAAMFIQYIMFGLLIYFVGRMSPMPFYSKSFEYQALAFSTSSTKATLPTAMRVCLERLGISKVSTSFVLPLGSSINMDGMAIYLGMCAIFFAQVTGTVLTFSDYLMIILTATLGSIGAAGIPGGSLVMLPMVLSSVGLPIGGIGLIAGVDRILDMLRTTVNLTGDVAITLLIDRSEGTLDYEKYMENDSKTNNDNGE